jgi:hypothetical protein
MLLLWVVGESEHLVEAPKSDSDSTRVLRDQLSVILRQISTSRNVSVPNLSSQTGSEIGFSFKSGWLVLAPIIRGSVLTCDTYPQPMRIYFKAACEMRIFVPIYAI